MNCWKDNFNEKTLKQGIKYKNNVEKISYDGCKFKATINSKFNVELIIQDNILYDMSCSCSKNHPVPMKRDSYIFLRNFRKYLKTSQKTVNLKKLQTLTLAMT